MRQEVIRLLSVRGRVRSCPKVYRNICIYRRHLVNPVIYLRKGWMFGVCQMGISHPTIYEKQACLLSTVCDGEEAEKGDVKLNFNTGGVLFLLEH